MSCRYTKYLLKFDGTTIGSYVNGMSTKPTRVNEIATRTSLWNTNPILDGRWPQIVWEHSISVYHEESTREAFADYVLDLVDLHTHDPKSLTVVGTIGSDSTIDMGLCYLTDMEMNTPELLLLYEAGIHIFSFIGTLKPTISGP